VIVQSVKPSQQKKVLKHLFIDKCEMEIGKKTTLSELKYFLQHVSQSFLKRLYSSTMQKITKIMKKIDVTPSLKFTISDASVLKHFCLSLLAHLAEGHESLWYGAASVRPSVRRPSVVVRPSCVNFFL